MTQVLSHTATDVSRIAPNRFMDLNGARVAYRHFGTSTGVPLVFLQRFRGNLEDWDSAVVSRLATKRPIVMFDGLGIGLSTGVPARDVTTLAQHAESFIDALEFDYVDLLGYSLGGFVAQQVALDRPKLVRKLVLAGTAPRGGEGFAPFRPDVDEAARKDHPGLEDLLTIFFQTPRRAERRLVRTGRDCRSGLPIATKSPASRCGMLSWLRSRTGAPRRQTIGYPRLRSPC